jgi:hypothetical protein
MNTNLFTRWCLQDRWLLEAKYRTIGGAGRSAGSIQSIQPICSMITERRSPLSRDVQEDLVL